MERWEEKEHREYLRAGTIAAAVLNPWRGQDRKNKPFTPYDFFDIPRPQKPKPTPEQLEARAASFFNSYNARVVKLDERRKKKA